MTLHLADWIIVAGFLAFLIAVTLGSRRHVQSVADFLVAGRCAGRYLISVSEGAAGWGAITLIAFWEIYYHRGFTAVYWSLLNWPIIFIIALTGWITYRFRQTKALTLAQFFEVRYTRRFRIFAGSICFICGVLNFGLFPAVGTQFFIYFCGLPETFAVGGLHLSTYATLMGGLLLFCLFFTFTGGQIAIILTDFMQGLASLSILVITVGILAYKVEWHNVVSALMQAPPGKSYIDPFDLGAADARTYTPRFFMIGCFMWFYQWMAWQGTQGFNASAKSPHEQRMSKVLGSWRYFAQEMLIPIIAVFALAFLHSPHLFSGAIDANTQLAGIADPEVRERMTVPLALSRLLPVGLMGGLCAVMGAAFISNHNSYLHSWGSIFIQDVVLPIRGKSFTPKTHLLLLRLSILGVAIFIYLFSLCFDSSQNVIMFFRATGGIYLGGAGAVIVGGLYSRRGTTTAAYAAMSVGVVASLTGFLLLETKPDTVHIAAIAQALIFTQKHLTGQDMMGIATALSIISYVLCSWLIPHKPFDLDRLLHRGAYADDAAAATEAPTTGLSLFRLGPEYTKSDKLLYLASYGWMGACGLVFVVGLIAHYTCGVSVWSWLRLWKTLVIIAMSLGTIVVVWFAIGGIRDMIEMLSRLRTLVRDVTDDGTVKHEDRPAACAEVVEEAENINA
jgi:SSS family solute:Na+ symporter